VRADQHGTTTHARRTDATYIYTPTPTLLPHDKHAAQRKAWAKTINDLAVYRNELARDDLRRRMAAAGIEPRPEWMDEYEEALETGAPTLDATPRMMTALDKRLLLMFTVVTEPGGDLTDLRRFTAGLYETL